jgi:uncharacterized protein YndB with AHSA1/START domain
MIDVDDQINAVQRTVGDRTLDAGQARVVTISQSYETDAADLWDACTDIERIPRWFLPITGDLRVGGSYQLEGNAHGTVQTCDPPREFTATWEFGDTVSWIEVRIIDEGLHRSRFELQHIAHADDHWEQFGPGATGMGYDGALVGLTIHLSTGRPVEQAWGQEWMASKDGRRFTRNSGEAWYRANVAAGADDEWARAAADRCIAAYLGEN